MILTIFLSEDCRNHKLNTYLDRYQNSLTCVNQEYVSVTPPPNKDLGLDAIYQLRIDHLLFYANNKQYNFSLSLHMTLGKTQI